MFSARAKNFFSKGCDEATNEIVKPEKFSFYDQVEFVKSFC